MDTVVVSAPAKINLFLAVTGRRPDGFHDLVSVVAPLELADTLRCELADTFSLACDAPDVPTDDSNLVLKAARAFAATTGWRGGARFALGKRIPAGAGLGGGSSDAVAALRALNQVAGAGLDAAALAALAAGIGSDGPLFLHDRPVIRRGRGERIEPLTGAAVDAARGRRVLVFKPAFGISTPWAYAELAPAAPAPYLPAGEAESRVARWRDGALPTEEFCHNTLEAPVFKKYVALPVLLDQLRERFGFVARMTGSGSACFGLLRDESPVPELSAAIRAAWGESAFIMETRLR